HQATRNSPAAGARNQAYRSFNWGNWSSVSSRCGRSRRVWGPFAGERPVPRERRTRDPHRRVAGSYAGPWSARGGRADRYSPSFLTVAVTSRFCPPISYSHFHVPTGSAFSSLAPARPQSPSAIAADRIAFMKSLRGVRTGAVRHEPPPAADGSLSVASSVAFV